MLERHVGAALRLSRAARLSGSQERARAQAQERGGHIMTDAIQQAPMTKGEREDLQRLIRQREKVLKSAAKQRSAELIADFENQMGSEFSFDDDAVWERAAKATKHEVARAQKLIAARCRELGIPD